MINNSMNRYSVFTQLTGEISDQQKAGLGFKYLSKENGIHQRHLMIDSWGRGRSSSSHCSGSQFLLSASQGIFIVWLSEIAMKNAM